jgi:hypothetical protein
MKDKKGRACGRYWDKRNAYRTLMRKPDYLDNLGVGVRVSK